LKIKKKLQALMEKVKKKWTLEDKKLVDELEQKKMT